MKRSTLALAFVSMMFTSLSVIGAEASTDKVGASGKCLGYLSMFNEEDLKAKPTRTRELLDLYKSSFTEAMQTSSIRKAIDSGFFAKTGADLSKDFYGGFILAGIFDESTKKINGAPGPHMFSTESSVTAIQVKRKPPPGRPPDP